MQEINGVLNILKPTGMTSHDVVSAVRRILGLKRVGHAGTLDPNVAGVLIICVGKGTRLSEWLMNGDKEYVCELILGCETDTQDSYGQLTNISSQALPSEYELIQTLKSFEGDQMQMPPAYSAVKLNGRKLYEYARDNVAVVKEARPVYIREIELLKYREGRALMRVICSKGTYMRTLCNDIGKALGTLGHMGVLVRTKAKGFSINDAITLEELKYNSDNGFLSECLIPPDRAYPLASVKVDDRLFDRLFAGNEVKINGDIPDGIFYVHCKGMLVGIGIKTGQDEIKINKMLT